MVLASKDDKRWDSLASSVDSLDHRCPLAIARLDSLWPASPLKSCHDKLGRDLAYYKASLVKVVDVLVKDAILSFCLLY